MQKTVFKVGKMDCPAEENLIRMALENNSEIKSLQFDLVNRVLTVLHINNPDRIFTRLKGLNLDTSFISTAETNETPVSTDLRLEKKLLVQVLAINFLFFVLEIVSGFLSNSMGLVADSLDMLADSLIYGLALLAVGKTLLFKQNIAKASGYFQMFLALFGIVEVVRRYITPEPTPNFKTMIIISSLALIGNALSLYILQKSKSTEAHMKASMIFTSNDVVVNIGVIVAGIAVYLSSSRLPDLIVGTIVFLIVGKGALRILKL